MGATLPPGIVPTEGEQVLKKLLKNEQEVEEFDTFWKGRIPAAPEPAPVQTPTEAQRAEVYTSAGWVGEAGEGGEG